MTGQDTLLSGVMDCGGRLCDIPQRGTGTGLEQSKTGHGDGMCMLHGRNAEMNVQVRTVLRWGWDGCGGRFVRLSVYLFICHLVVAFPLFLNRPLREGLSLLFLLLHIPSSACYGLVLIQRDDITRIGVVIMAMAMAVALGMAYVWPACFFLSVRFGLVPLDGDCGFSWKGGIHKRCCFASFFL